MSALLLGLSAISISFLHSLALQPSSGTKELAQRGELLIASFVVLSILTLIAFGFFLKRILLKDRQAQARIRRSEALHRRIIESATEGILVLHESGQIRFANPRFKWMTGYTASELEGLPISRMSVEPFSLSEGFSGDLRFIRKDGSVFWGFISLSKIPESSELLAMIADVTDRKAAEKTLSDSEAHFRYLAETIPYIVFSFDRNGSTQYFNRRWVDYSGAPETENVTQERGWPIAPYLHPEDRPSAERSWHLSLERRTEFHREVRIRNKEGTYLWHYCWGLPVVEPSGRLIKWICTLTNVDSHRKNQQERLRILDLEKEARSAAERAVENVTRIHSITSILSSSVSLKQVTRSALEGGCQSCDASFGAIGLISPEGKLNLVETRGYTEEQIRYGQGISLSSPGSLTDAIRERKPLWISSPEEYMERYPHFASVFKESGIRAVAAIPLVFREQVLGCLSLGFVQNHPFSPESRQFILTIADQCAQAIYRAQLFESERAAKRELEQTVQELDHSRRQLGQLTLKLEQIQEEERTRISREIHDELGQSLTVLKMELFDIKRKLTSEQEQLKTQISAMIQAVTESVQSVRRIASDLRPAVLGDLGLPAAIEWLINDFKNRTGTECRLKLNLPEVQLPTETSFALFRILQEALTNAARHAETQKIDIALSKVMDKIELQIRDYGKGISEDLQAKNSGSLGIIGMRERARHLGGAFSIERIKGTQSGTKVTVQVPHQGCAEGSATI